MTAPRPSIFSSCSDHSLRVRCCSVMRLVLWHEVQAAFTLACTGPGGNGLPGALGACALARMMDANRKIAGTTRSNTQDSFLSSQFSVLSSQFSVLSSQNWMCFLVLWIRNFCLFVIGLLVGSELETMLPLPLVEQVDGFENRIPHDFEAFGA